jgi:hypothetical protein
MKGKTPVLEHRAGDGGAREPAHDQALRPLARTAHAGRGGDDQVVTRHTI